MKTFSMPANPRHAAYETLSRLVGSDLHADALIDQELSRNNLTGPDRGLYSELVFGVLRRQGTLDYYLGQMVDQPLERLQQPVLLALRLGMYQLLYLDRVPDHAAVHEAVELAKVVCPKASGLVNGVLRNFVRKRDQIRLPDRGADPAGWLAATCSVPVWLAEQWLRQFPLDEAAALGAATLTIPPLTLRANTLRISRSALLEHFASEAVSAAPCLYAQEGIRLTESCRIIDLPGFREGLFTIQDEASQLVAHLLGPCPGESVLDVCAAPGGKATHLAQLMQNRGELTATDLNERKIRKIREAAERLGITCLDALIGDGLSPAYQQGRQFDRVLLDAPCSGLGVIRRNPEAKWRLAPAEFSRFAQRQICLLDAVAPLVRHGGVLVYATCSTAPEEDEAVVEDFLSRNPRFVLESGDKFFTGHAELITPSGCLRTWPHRQGSDGFFAARLKRIDR